MKKRTPGKAPARRFSTADEAASLSDIKSTEPIRDVSSKEAGATAKSPATIRPGRGTPAERGTTGGISEKPPANASTTEASGSTRGKREAGATTGARPKVPRPRTAKDAAKAMPPGSEPDDTTDTGKPAKKAPPRSMSATTNARRWDDNFPGRREG